MKRVCFFLTSLNSGGIENYLLRFMKHYDYEIMSTIYCKSGEFGELESEFQKLSNIQLIKSKLGYCDVKSFYKLFHYFNNNEFDVICDFTGNFAGIILLLAKFVGVKKRIAFYRGSSNRFKPNILRKLYNQLMNKMVLINATSILSNSQTAIDFFFRKKDYRFKIIYNGIDIKKLEIKEKQEDIRKEFNIPRNAFVIGHIGRVHYSKNQKTIIKVANIICERYNDIHFVLCGKNTENELPDLIGEQVKNQIHLLGYRKDVPRILKSFDIFIFPSLTEGQPNALIEAMIMGLPIIASNIDPIKETVPEGIHNLLISPLDIEQIKQTIEDYYENRYFKNQNCLKEWAISRFQAEKRFYEFYNELVT